MSYVFKAKTVRAYELAITLNSLSPSELARVTGEDSIKNIKMGDKLVEELRASNVEFFDEMDKINAKKLELSLKLKADIEALTETDDEKKKAAAKEMEDKANELLKKEIELINVDGKVDNAGLAEVEVKIASDERYVFLKACLSKLVEKYINRKALIETVEAIESAKQE